MDFFFITPKKEGKNKQKQTPHIALQHITEYTSLGFSIIPTVYEEKLDKKYGIILSKLQNGKKSNVNTNLEEKLPFNGGDNHPLDKIQQKILNAYAKYPDFCSMNIANETQLEEHVQFIHEKSYLHYIWGKEKNFKGQFPHWCCGLSASNLFLSLMAAGYPNAAFVYNSAKDHAYVCLPFQMNSTQTKGFIIVDPTSDQLFNDKTRAPRNNTFVSFKQRWDYVTDWKQGANLYPSLTDNATFSNLYTLRIKPKQNIYESNAIDQFFKEVFKNSIQLPKQPIEQ